MQLFMNDLSNDEITLLLNDCDEELISLKKKLVSIKLERDILQRKMKLIKKEKEILQLVRDEKQKEKDSNEAFKKFLSTDNYNSELSQSLNLRYTNSLRRYGESSKSLNSTVITNNSNLNDSNLFKTFE